MIRTISAVGKFTLGPDLEKYTSGKLDDVEKEIPRNLRRYAHIEVRFESRVVSGKRENTCAMDLRLPREVFTATETTQHIYAALDIAAADIAEQLIAYKAGHPGLFRQRLRRFKRQA